MPCAASCPFQWAKCERHMQGSTEPLKLGGCPRGPGHTASKGPGPTGCLIILQMCDAGGCSLPSSSRRLLMTGQRAQSPGDPKGAAGPWRQAKDHTNGSARFGQGSITQVKGSVHMWPLLLANMLSPQDQLPVNQTSLEKAS